MRSYDSVRDNATDRGDMADAFDDEAPIAQLVERVAADGFAVVPGFLGPPAVAGLAARALALDAAGAMKPAAIGKGALRSERADIRGDRTCWLGAATHDEHEALLFRSLESVRLAANRSLALGLFEFEGHYAIYPPGAGYERHRDVFRGEATVPGARVLSCILYLNVGWRTTDGGELVLFLGNGTERPVMPDAGTMVAFLADRFEHEVRPARRERMSVTGWFRRRPV
jgi:SM-20-related protein